MKLFLGIFAAGMFLTVVTDCAGDTGNDFLQKCSIVEKYNGNAEKGTYDEIVNFVWPCLQKDVVSSCGHIPALQRESDTEAVLGT